MRGMMIDYGICWCRACRPGWRNSKRDVRLVLGDVLKSDGRPPEGEPIVFREFGLAPIFLRKALA